MYKTIEIVAGGESFRVVMGRIPTGNREMLVYHPENETIIRINLGMVDYIKTN